MATVAVSCAYKDDENSVSLYMGYIRALIRAGATPILVYSDLPRFVLPKVDGLVLTGGGDIASALLTGFDMNEKGLVQLNRDLFELSLVEQCKNVPVLGICRGMQVLNTAFNGELNRHFCGHSLKQWQRHRVKVIENTNLAKAIGEGTYLVNSVHHQGVSRVPAGFRVCAVSDDGIIEAMEHKEKPYIGVQWHPEKLCSTASDRLFKYFVSLCDQKNSIGI